MRKADRNAELRDRLFELAKHNRAAAYRRLLALLTEREQMRILQRWTGWFEFWEAQLLANQILDGKKGQGVVKLQRRACECRANPNWVLGSLPSTTGSLLLGRGKTF